MKPHFPIVIRFISSIYGILIETAMAHHRCLLSCSAPCLDLSHFELDMANSSTLCSLSSRLIVKAHHCLSFGIPTGILVRISPKYRPLCLSWYPGRERMHIIETWFPRKKGKVRIIERSLNRTQEFLPNFLRLRSPLLNAQTVSKICQGSIKILTVFRIGKSMVTLNFSRCQDLRIRR